MDDVNPNPENGHQRSVRRTRDATRKMTSVAYISASANRYSQTADISSPSLCAFGSGKLIALWDIAVSALADERSKIL
jgi:hypothetical protein